MYDVFTLDLSAILSEDTPRVLVPAGKRIAEIIVFSVPAFAVFRLRVGTAGKFFTVPSPFTMEPTTDGMSNEGLYFANLAAQPGTTVEMVVVYAGGELSANLA